MSGAEIVELSESRRRRGILTPRGRHRRTPEAWAQMEADRAADKAAVAQMRRERDQAVAEKVSMEETVLSMRQEMAELRSEVRALTGPSNVTVIPSASRDAEETQPISQAELFEADPMAPLRPQIRVHDFPQPPPGAVSDFLSRIVPPDATATQLIPAVVPEVMPLWKVPRSA